MIAKTAGAYTLPRFHLDGGGREEWQTPPFAFESLSFEWGSPLSYLQVKDAAALMLPVPL